MTCEIILASGSPYKRAAMRKTGLSFSCIPSDFDEESVSLTNPKDLCLHLSEEKARAVFRDRPSATVIGVDSIGFFDGTILTKPKSREEAVERLRVLSGKTHRAITGVTILSATHRKQAIVETEITFRELSDREILAYVDADPDIGHYCLGYDPEGDLSATFIREVRGSYNNLLSGMPIEVILPLLNGLH